MYRVLRIYLLFLFLVLNLLSVNIANADEDYIGAEDIGQELPKITIKAKPEAILSTVGYSTESSSQMANWVDSEYYTNGDDSGFFLEITGGWNPWGGDTSDASNMCITTTENKYSDEIDTTNSEFDYINSSYKISKDQYGNYSTETQPAESQKKCWLTGGTGLYIGFFGNSGYNEPDFATHLKAVDIACDNWVDSNDDGIMTVDECRDEKGNNMAYYKPYYSSDPASSSYIKGYARCPLSSFTGEPTHIKVNECYETIDGKQYNRIRFVFEAQFLYKNSTKSIVGKNEKIKLTILDNYYSDNSGEYNLVFYRGVTTNKVEGILEKIIRAIEEAFSIGAIKDNFKTILHSTNTLNINNFSIINEAYAENNNTYSEEEEVYEKKVSIIKRFYLYIVQDSSFMQVIRIFIALYISFLGLRVVMGTSEYSVKELLILLLKLTFILGFTTETGWAFYNKYIVRSFLLGLMSITITLINIVNKLYLFTNADGSLTYLRITDFGTLSQIFGGIDQIIKSLFSKSVTIKIFALFFGHWYGFLVVPIIYILIFYFMYQILNASFPIIIAYVQLIFGLMLGPVFICLYLFKTTEHMFKNWLSFLCARVANITFVVLMLSTFASIIKKQFNALLNFPVRTTGFFSLIFPALRASEWFLSLFSIQINWNVKVYVPDFSGTNAGHFATFFTIIMHLILIFVLIFMFGKLAKMIPSIVDSMIKIGDGDGGKMEKIIGNSTFTGAMDKSFKSFFDTDKGMLKTVKRIGGDLTAPARNFLDDEIWRKMKVNVSNWYYKKDKAWESTTNGMTSAEAVKTITDNYADTLGHKWFRKHGTMNKKMSEFREDVQKHFLVIEANNLRDKLLKNEGIMSRYSDLLNNQAVINRLIQNQIGMNLGKYDVGKYDTYLSKIANIGSKNDINYDETKFIELQGCFRVLADTNYLPRLKAEYEKLEKENYSGKIRETFNILYGTNSDDLLKDEKTAEFLTNVVKELREAANTVDECKRYSFLMQGIDIKTFGTGANMSNFCMSGIGNDFLGFNGGASAITSGMGVALTDNEESKNIVESIKPFIFYEYRKLRGQDYEVSKASLTKSETDLKDKRQKLKELKEQKKRVAYELRRTNDDKLKQEVSQLSTEIEAQRKDEEEATKEFMKQNRRNLDNINEEEELIKLGLKQLKEKEEKEKKEEDLIKSELEQLKEKEEKEWLEENEEREEREKRSEELKTKKEEKEKKLEELKTKKEKEEKRLEELKTEKIAMAKRLKESLKESEEINEEKLKKLNEKIEELSKKVDRILTPASLPTVSTSMPASGSAPLPSTSTSTTTSSSTPTSTPASSSRPLTSTSAPTTPSSSASTSTSTTTSSSTSTSTPVSPSRPVASTSTPTTPSSSASTSTPSSIPAVASAPVLSTSTATPKEREELLRKNIDDLNTRLTELDKKLQTAARLVPTPSSTQLPSTSTSATSTPAPTSPSGSTTSTPSSTASTSSTPTSSSTATPTSSSTTSPVPPTTSSVSPSTTTPTSPTSTTSSATTTSSASTSTSTSSSRPVASITTPTQQELARKEIENLNAELAELRRKLDKSKTAINKELERQKSINSILSDIEIPDLPSVETSSSSTTPTASSTPSATASTSAPLSTPVVTSATSTTTPTSSSSTTASTTTSTPSLASTTASTSSTPSPSATATSTSSMPTSSSTTTPTSSSTTSPVLPTTSSVSPSMTTPTTPPTPTSPTSTTSSATSGS